MRTLLCSFAVLCCIFLQLDAQVILSDAVKPSESVKCTLFKSGEGTMRLGGYNASSGFALGSPQGGLISDEISGKAVFQLDGFYSKLSFIVGPWDPNPSSDQNNGIVTISADGRLIFDEVIAEHDAPRFVTLDINGARELKFYVPKGSVKAAFASVKLWKPGQQVSNPNKLFERIPKGTIALVTGLPPYFLRNGYVKPVVGDKITNGLEQEKSISITRKLYTSGLQFNVGMGLTDNDKGYAYFWLNKRYDKVSFVLGPRDNQSKNASAWIVVKGDKRTLYETCVHQKDMSQQVVLDVKGVEQLSIFCEYRSSDFLGGLTVGVADIFAHVAGDASVPVPGTVNPNKDEIARLPDICPLMSSIAPFSVRGIAKSNNTLFTGESRHYTFSMGGVKYWEGLLLTTGNTLLGDMIDSYAEFDLAGEYDWISFDAGCLSKKHIMDDDNLRIYADDKLVFDHTIYCTWPNQRYQIPVYKCRTLRFEKPGNGKNKQTIIGVGDIILYRGQPAANNIFEHEMPDCPYEADLIDLCGRPYFHYVGRYASDLTDFSMDDCFRDGSTITKYFQMKDGRQINKGFMLETNIPLGLENVTFMDAMFMFLTGVGASVSHSGISAYTGVSAGADGTPVGSIFLLLADKDSKQSSAAAFNPFGQYESCTFTVANKTEKVDEFDEVFGNKSLEAQNNPVKLNVFADQLLVGEYWLDNKMQPLTITVPIFKCRQLMFWLECGDTRSGQYVFYDLKVSKAPCNIPIPEEYTPGRVQSSRAGVSVRPVSEACPSARKRPVVIEGVPYPDKEIVKSTKARPHVEWDTRAQ